MTTLRFMIGLCFGVLLAVGATGQDSADGVAGTAGAGLPAGPAEAPVLQPEREGSGELGLVREVPRASPGVLIGEGAFVSGAFAEIIEIEGGGWAVRLLEDDRERVSRVMVAQPTERLEELLRFAERSVGRRVFRVSGQVFAYGDLNYLLLTSYNVAGDPVTGEAADAQSDEAADGGTDVLEELEDDGGFRRPGLFELFDLGGGIGDAFELLRQGGEADMADRPDGGPDEAGVGADETDLDRLFDSVESAGDRRPERVVPGVGSGDAVSGRDGAGRRAGAVISRRSGRLVPGQNGVWLFVSDNDADVAPSASDAPLTVLPCRLLESMERVALDSSSGSPRVVLSGRVYVFRGQGFVLPSVFGLEAEATGALRSLQ